MDSLEARSFVCSQIHLTKTAYVQLVKRALVDLSRQDLSTDAITVSILEINIVECNFTIQGVEHRFDSRVEIKNVKGLTSYHAKLPVNIFCLLKPATINKPSILVDKMKVDIRETSSIKLFRLDMTIPKFVRRKISKNFVDRKGEIEAAINNEVEKKLNGIIKTLKKGFEMPVSGLKKRYINPERVHWSSEFRDNGLLLDLYTVFRLDVQRYGIAECIWLHGSEHLVSPKLSLYLLLFKSEIRTILKGEKISLGDNRELTIGDISIQSESPVRALFRIVMEGELAGEALITLRVQNAGMPLIKIENLNLNMENKLLDFGVSLFENKLAKKTTEVLNRRIEEKINGFIAEMNKYKNAQLAGQLNFSSDSWKRSDVDISVEFHSRDILIHLSTSIFDHVTILELPGSKAKIA